ncbi:MAG TPA: HAD family hydrolase [Gemmatimonadaceae bacterium]|nr:HAD family hydrolase [Gemmatimonadaceae bacterium]
MSRRPAAFLDRDGTIIYDASYVRDPDDVVLLDGAGEAIKTLNARGIAVILVTNQSGIARGWLTHDDYARVHARLVELLAEDGARLDGAYMCPHHPDITGPCECRKPGLALYRQAIEEHGLDPARSLFTGDRWRDVAAAEDLGGLGIMLDVASTPPEDHKRARIEGVLTAGSLRDAVDRYLATLPAASSGQ